MQSQEVHVLFTGVTQHTHTHTHAHRVCLPTRIVHMTIYAHIQYCALRLLQHFQCLHSEKVGKLAREMVM